MTQLSIHSTPTGQALSVLLWEDVRTYDIVGCPEPRSPKCLPLIGLHVSRMSVSFYFGGFGGSWPATQPHPSPSSLIFQGSRWDSPCNLIILSILSLCHSFNRSWNFQSSCLPRWDRICEAWFFVSLPLLTLHYIAYVDFIILHCLKVAVCSPIWGKSRAILYSDLLWTKPGAPTRDLGTRFNLGIRLGWKGRGRVRRGNVSGMWCTITRPKENP